MNTFLSCRQTPNSLVNKVIGNLQISRNDEPLLKYRATITDYIRGVHYQEFRRACFRAIKQFKEMEEAICSFYNKPCVYAIRYKRCLRE